MEIDSKNPTENEAAVSQDSAAKNSSARVKRMRGWLGIKSTTASHVLYDNSEAPVYGDGHSGWNR